jgi:TRAP-type C4-dicarboxylate transport system permease small subunit
MRRFLDGLYSASGGLAAACLGLICFVMLLQVAARESGFLLRGADDVTAWLCAASAFLALGHTFRKGELVRMMLAIDGLDESRRRAAEVFALTVTAMFVGYMAWAVIGFVHESWKLNELSQGLLRVPVWIPQAAFAAGVLILLVAVLDELAVVLRRGKPSYIREEEERRARGDFSEGV